MPPICAARRRARRFFHEAHAAAWVIALCASAAFAQQEPEAEAELPAVEVVAQRPTRAPAAQATVIETARFAGEARSVAEMVSTSPGVSIHSLGGPGQLTTLSLRGASADQSLVLLDGIPLKGPGGGSVDLSTLPASLLETLVVSRGVLGAQLGAGALGGVLELLPRAAGRERASGGAQIEYGSFGTARLAVDLGTPLGRDSGLTGAAQLDRTRGDYVYERQYTPELPNAPYYEETRANADARRGAALLRWAQRLTSTTELDLLLQGSAGERGLPGPIGNPTTHARVSDAGGVAGARVRGSAGGAVWTLRTWARQERLTLRGIAPFGDCIDGQPGCAPDSERSSAASSEAQVRWPLGSRQLIDALISGGGEWASGTGIGNHRRSLFALAVSDDIQIQKGLSLHPALRAEKVGVDWAASPGVGALWKLAGLESGACSAWFCALEIRGAIGRSFRPASFSELYMDRGGFVSNPELRPERAWSADVGAAWRGERITVALGAFWSAYHDLIIYELFPPARAKPFNIGAARIAGFETQAIVALPHAFVAEAAYSFLDAVNRQQSLTQGGQPLPYRPLHRLFLRLARRGDQLEGYAELSAISSMPRNSFGTSFTPGQLIVNAGGGARVFGPLWIDVEVKNALDDRTLQDLFLYPLPGLSVSAIARARL